MSEPTPLRLPRLNDYLAHWARMTADKPAMLQHEDGKTLTYKQFNRVVDFFALRLLDMGIGPGDRVATQLVLVPEHMALMYACFKIGAIMAPLDVRLQDAEVVRDVNKIAPKAFFFLGDTPVRVRAGERPGPGGPDHQRERVDTAVAGHQGRVAGGLAQAQQRLQGRHHASSGAQLPNWPPASVL